MHIEDTLMTVSIIHRIPSSTLIMLTIENCNLHMQREMFENVFFGLQLMQQIEDEIFLQDCSANENLFFQSSRNLHESIYFTTQYAMHFGVGWQDGGRRLSVSS